LSNSRHQQSLVLGVFYCAVPEQPGVLIQNPVVLALHSSVQKLRFGILLIPEFNLRFQM